MTHNMWAKAFWKGGSNFSPTWAVPAQQWPAAIHTIDFNGFWIRPLYPFQNEFWLLNWNLQLWAALAQDKASLHKSCVFGQGGIHGQVTAQIHCSESSAAMGFTDPNTGRGFAAGFQSSLRYMDGISLTSQRPPLSICSPKRWLSVGRAAGIQSFPHAEQNEAQSMGLVELRGCKPGVAGSRAVMRGDFICPAEEEGVLYMAFVCLVLELDRQLYIGFVYKVHMSTKRRALTRLVIKGCWRRWWYVGIFAVPTDVLSKRSCDVV